MDDFGTPERVINPTQSAVFRARLGTYGLEDGIMSHIPEVNDELIDPHHTHDIYDIYAGDKNITTLRGLDRLIE